MLLVDMCKPVLSAQKVASFGFRADPTRIRCQWCCVSVENTQRRWRCWVQGEPMPIFLETANWRSRVLQRIGPASGRVVMVCATSVPYLHSVALVPHLAASVVHSAALVPHSAALVPHSAASLRHLTAPVLHWGASAAIPCSVAALTHLAASRLFRQWLESIRFQARLLPLRHRLR